MLRVQDNLFATRVQVWNGMTGQRQWICNTGGPGIYMGLYCSRDLGTDVCGLQSSAADDYLLMSQDSDKTYLKGSTCVVSINASQFTCFNMLDI